MIILAPTVARYKLYGDELPFLTDTLLVGELMRQALMSQSRGLDGGPHALAIFSARHADGSPVRDDHAHAFFLPSDDDGDGRLDHVIVYAPQGFNNRAIVAIGRVQRLWRPGRRDDLEVALEGLGHPEDYGNDLASGRGYTDNSHRTALLGFSQVWVSKTPFLLVRHPKTYRDGRPKLNETGLQIDGPEMQLVNELERRGLPRPVSIEPVSGTRVGDREIRWSEFQRERARGGGSLGSRLGYGFRLTFPEAVRGPIAIGYGCHFGLGLFVAGNKDSGEWPRVLWEPR